MTEKERTNLVQLEDKELKFNEIFRLEDFKDAKQAKKLEKFIDQFVYGYEKKNGIAKAGMKLDDVSIVVEKGEKYVKVDYDNKGVDKKRTVNRKFNYADVFNNAGFLQRDNLLKKIRKDIIENILPQIDA